MTATRVRRTAAPGGEQPEPLTPTAGLTRTLGRWSFRQRRVVALAWLIALVLITAVSQAAGITYASKLSLPNSPSARALAILQHDFPAASGDADQIVFESSDGPITSAADRARIAPVLDRIGSLPHVAGVVSPFAPAGGPGAGQISRDGTIAFATVNFDEQAQDLPANAVDAVVRTAESVRGPGLTVALAGQAIENVEPQQSSHSTLLGIILALIVLGLAFGAFFAAITPVVTALVAIGIGYGVSGLLTHALTIVSFAPILGILIGLGVGIDYALFIVTRHRHNVQSGRSIEDAAVDALDTSGRAVLLAGVTVAIALLGQVVLGVSFLDGAAVAATVTVLLTMAASLTLLPALLGFMGPRVLSRRQRARLGRPGPADPTGGGWHRWSLLVERRRRPMALAGLLLVIVVALPLLTLRLGLDDAGTDPAGSTTHQAYDLLARGFGPGFNGPFELVSTIASPANKSTFADLLSSVARQPGVVATTPAQVSPSGTAEVALVYPSTGPQAAGTVQLLDHLRDEVVPQAEAGSGLDVLIGGVTATQVDFSRNLAGKLPAFVAVVVVLAFLLLMLVFRSLVVPLMASVMNLLSVGAALGIMNAVFEWGWGSSALGLSGTAPVEVFLPALMFSVLFGLSMDYEVFLVSRIREEWIRTADNGSAVTTGQSVTGRVITAAATIMICVFLAFVANDSIVIKEFGVGLAAAVFIDAFVVRTALVPALMHLAGPANWWLPDRLDRRLPRRQVEAASGTQA